MNWFRQTRPFLVPWVKVRQVSDRIMSETRGPLHSWAHRGAFRREGDNEAQEGRPVTFPEAGRVAGGEFRPAVVCIFYVACTPIKSRWYDTIPTDVCTAVPGKRYKIRLRLFYSSPSPSCDTKHTLHIPDGFKIHAHISYSTNVSSRPLPGIWHRRQIHISILRFLPIWFWQF